MQRVMPIRMVRRTCVILAALLLGGLLVACSGETRVNVTQPEQSGITVVGTGTASVVPDIGVINVGVEVQAANVAAARTQAAETMARIQAALKKSGVDDKDVQTQFFNIFPRYDQPKIPNGAPQISGYTVNNQVTVKVRNIDRLSQVLDGAIAAGGDAVRVNSVGFAVDKPEQAQAQARDKAMADAKARAEQLAKQAGVQLGKVRSVSEVIGGNTPVPYLAAGASAGGKGGGPTPISSGEQEITASVSMVFEIK